MSEFSDLITSDIVLNHYAGSQIIAFNIKANVQYREAVTDFGNVNVTGTQQEIVFYIEEASSIKINDVLQLSVGDIIKYNNKDFLVNSFRHYLVFPGIVRISTTQKTS